MRLGGAVTTVAGAVVGTALLVTGVVAAVHGYEQTAGPDGAVRSYFRALADGDAPRALGWSVVTPGPHPYLTSTVLREQQRIAPLRDVRVGPDTTSGGRARVRVGYRLAFAAGDVPVTQTVTVVRRDGEWRMAAGSVDVQLGIDEAAHRARVLRHAVPASTIALFPGAVPISFDSPYLQLVAGDDHVELDSSGSVEVGVGVTPAGRRAALAAVRAALQRCLRTPDPSCPLPDLPVVPGSVRGRLASVQLDVSLSTSADGVVQVDGIASVEGSYRLLSFTNRAATRTGPLSLDVHARAYAVDPLRFQWTTT